MHALSPAHTLTQWKKFPLPPPTSSTPPLSLSHIASRQPEIIQKTAAHPDPHSATALRLEIRHDLRQGNLDSDEDSDQPNKRKSHRDSDDDDDEEEDEDDKTKKKLKVNTVLVKSTISPKTSQVLHYWDKSENFRVKLKRLDQILSVVNGNTLHSEDFLALHSLLLKAASDSSQQVSLRDHGVQICTMLWTKFSGLAKQNVAEHNRLAAELKESFQNSTALLALGLCQPLSCACSKVKLCSSNLVDDPIQSKVGVLQTVYAFISFCDEWRDNIASQQIKLELSRQIKICCSLDFSSSCFRASNNEDWLVCELTVLCPGSCQVHIQLGDNIKNVLGDIICFEVEAEKPAYLKFVDALEVEQKVHSGDDWIVDFEVISNLGKPWKCKPCDIKGYVSPLSSDSDSITEYAVRVYSGDRQNETKTTFTISLRNEDMPRGVYSLVVCVHFAGEALTVDSSPARFTAYCSRDPRKWSAEDVITFIRQHIDVDQNVLWYTESSDSPSEVNGQILIDFGSYYLRDWLVLAPKQSDFKEKMQKIETLMKEIKSLDDEARFAEGPHKDFLKKCIKKRDVEIDSERIGNGGSAEVFKGVWRDRMVAVKMPPKGQQIDLIGTIKALQFEVEKMQRCSHRNVVICHGLMVELRIPTSAGIVMELCSGSLVDLFAGKKKPSWNRRLNAALDAAQGLAYLHSLPIIHRDVKPENFLIAPGGVIKVADFGLARRADLTATKLTSIAGTEGWMSPEQLGGSEGLPSDVWGFGCIVYFLVTGRQPWPDMHTPAAIRTAILVERVGPSAPSPLPRGCPESFAQLCSTCCQFDPAPRPNFKTIVQIMTKLSARFPDDAGFKLPHNWKAGGAGASGLEEELQLVELAPTDEDFAKIAAYLQHTMPAASVSRIEMNCDSALYRLYYWCRDRVARQSGCEEAGADPEEQSNERWLWHGMRDPRTVAEVLKNGYQVQHASLEFNFYGAGNYFASDARLANWFAQGLRVQAQDGSGLQRRKLILNRVACGRMYPRASVLDSSFNSMGRRLNPAASPADANFIRGLLRRTEHRTAPRGFDSVVGSDPSREAGTEVVVYDNYLAFPAYVVTYTLPDDLPDPYAQPRPYLKTLDEVKRDPLA